MSQIYQVLTWFDGKGAHRGSASGEQELLGGPGDMHKRAAHITDSRTVSKGDDATR